MIREDVTQRNDRWRQLQSQTPAILGNLFGNHLDQTDDVFVRMFY